ncbi:MAG: MCE family protein [Prevotella sp.]|nr:MCE family protein [Prevotella sp.]
MKILTNEVKIALVAIVGVVLLFFGMQFLKGLTLTGSGNTYYAVFSDVSGMSVSSPVYANGYKVGVVEAIDYDYSRPDRIVAVVGLDKQLRVPEGSRAEIASDMLGNVKIELRLARDTETFLAVGDTINGAMQQGLMGKAGELMPQIEQMLPKLDSILASVNQLLADPALGQSLHNVEDITASLNNASRQLSALAASLNQQMPQMLSKADGVLSNTEGLTRQLNDVDVAATMQKVDATLANVQQMTDALNQKDGTLGLLMHDRSLYNNLSNAMRDADSLVIDLKQHPKRYVHFSVFGKKDK